jgi:hypothetical protein
MVGLEPAVQLSIERHEVGWVGVCGPPFDGLRVRSCAVEIVLILSLSKERTFRSYLSFFSTAAGER